MTLPLQQEAVMSFIEFGKRVEGAAASFPEDWNRLSKQIRGDVPLLTISKLLWKNYDYKLSEFQTLSVLLHHLPQRLRCYFYKRRYNNINRSPAGFDPHGQIVRATAYMIAREMVIKKPDVKTRCNWKTFTLESCLQLRVTDYKIHHSLMKIQCQGTNRRKDVISNITML
jgi:hypothetical protein